MEDDDYKDLCDGFGRDHGSMEKGFHNPWSEKALTLGKSFENPKTFFQLAKFMFSRREDDNTLGGKNQYSPEVLDKHLPVHKFDGSEYKDPPIKGIRSIWLGHATCLVQFDGVTVLTDPALNYRCSPFQKFGGYARLREIPCTIEKLPPIDIVVVSHNHYDHLDYDTVKRLNSSQGDRMHWYVGLGLKSWFTASGCKNVHEMDWWDEYKHSDSVKVIFTPTQHWSKRTATDTNKTLWGSFLVKGPDHSFYHAGDTGYCQTFKTIGEKYGPIDFATIPIGAYKPRSFLRCQHVDPAEAVKIHQDIRAKRSLGIHWGTWPLGKEPFLEPPRLLNEFCLNANLKKDEFFTSHIGKPEELFTDTQSNL